MHYLVTVETWRRYRHLKQPSYSAHFYISKCIVRLLKWHDINLKTYHLRSIDLISKIFTKTWKTYKDKPPIHTTFNVFILSACLSIIFVFKNERHVKGKQNNRFHRIRLSRKRNILRLCTFALVLELYSWFKFMKSLPQIINGSSTITYWQI